MGVVERPGKPEKVVFWLQEKARQLCDDREPNAGQIGLLAGKMHEAMLCNDKHQRHLCLRYIWGVDSSKLLTRGQVEAMLRWLVDGRDDTGDYVLNSFAIKELVMIWTAAQKAAGQQEVKFEDLKSAMVAADKDKTVDELVAELFG